MRAIFKQCIGLFGILLLLAIVAGSTFIFYQCFRPRPVITSRKAIKDSIQFYQDRKVMHQDSAKFFQHKYEEFTVKSDSLDAADSTTLARMRADYRANLRTKIADQIRTGAD